jgi:hypothetical protein
MPKTKQQPKEEVVAAEETVITPIDASPKELVGTSLESFQYQPKGAIAHANPAIKGVWQNVGNQMQIKHN